MDNEIKKNSIEESKENINIVDKNNSQLDIEKIKLQRLEYTFYASLFGCISAFINFVQDMISYVFPKEVYEKSITSNIDYSYIIYSGFIFIIFLSLSITLYNLKTK